jgi:hypothetical protein
MLLRLMRLLWVGGRYIPMSPLYLIPRETPITPHNPGSGDSMTGPTV